jgi:hypothetical protein
MLPILEPMRLDRFPCRFHDLVGTTGVIGDKSRNVIDHPSIGDPNWSTIRTIVFRHLGSAKDGQFFDFFVVLKRRRRRAFARGPRPILLISIHRHGTQNKSRSQQDIVPTSSRQSSGSSIRGIAPGSNSCCQSQTCDISTNRPRPMAQRRAK